MATGYQYQFALKENSRGFRPTYYNALEKRLKANKCKTVLSGWFLWVPKKEYRKIRAIVDSMGIKYSVYDADRE